VRYLVDGYNYLHRARLLRGDLQRARRGLEARLVTLRGRGHQVTVVWDARRAPPGLPGREERASVESVYARGSAGSADAAILDRLRHADDPRRYVVVTDDREVAGAARQLGARTASVAEVEAIVAPPSARDAPAGEDPASEKPPAPSPGEVAGWLDYFGASEEEKEG
jgi:predicted RNA-binding protein with PIN domain